jgi:hypothetical protein
MNTPYSDPNPLHRPDILPKDLKIEPQNNSPLFAEQKPSAVKKIEKPKEEKKSIFDKRKEGYLKKEELIAIAKKKLTMFETKMKESERVETVKELEKSSYKRDQLDKDKYSKDLKRMGVMGKTGEERSDAKHRKAMLDKIKNMNV